MKNNLLIVSSLTYFSITAPAQAMQCQLPTTATLSTTTTASATHTDTDYSLLHEAAYNGNVEHICELCDAGVDVNICSKTLGGLTPLHIAAKQGRVNAVIALVAIGADPTITSDDKKTPLDLTAPKQLTEILEAIQRGLEIKDQIQQFALKIQDDQPKAIESDDKKLS